MLPELLKAPGADWIPGFILDILSDDINSSTADQQKDYREYVEDRDEVLQKDFVP